jgi:glycosyltransferase involved in cell wall biosynthesis
VDQLTTGERGLNILYVGTLPPHPGGSAISGAVLIEAFASAGHHVRALATMTAETRGTRDVFAESHPDVPVSRFQVSHFEISPFTPPPEDELRREGEALRAALEEMLSAERPDVILMGRESFAWHVPDVAIAAKIPCVLRIAGTTTLGMLRGAFPDAQAKRLLENFQKAEWVVSPARHLAGYLRQCGLERVEVIPNSLNLERFFPQPKSTQLAGALRVSDGDIVVMHISNLKALKRPMDVVLCAERSLARKPGLLFVIVGDGPYRRLMEEECARRGISHRFRFTGWVDYAEVPRYINFADMILMACETDAQARVYLETQACARLLIVSDVPSAREVVADGETGVLFQKENVDDMSRVLLNAAGDPARRAVIGENARRRVQIHSVRHCAAAYLEVLARAASGGGRRSG